MTVLVTGGAGYIGSHMVWSLLDSGERVIVLDRLSTGFDWAVAPEARLIVGDIGDIALVRKALRTHEVDSILHFAGSTVVPDSLSAPLAYYANNTCRTRDLIEAAVEEGVENFIFSSTAAVYGRSGAGAPVTEEAQPVPETPYGASKLMSEWMLRDAAAAHRLRYTILRYFNVAGADPRGRTGQSTAGATHLIKVACETALGKRPIIDVFGTDYPTPDGTCVRDFIHVSDLVEAHRLALARLRDGGSNLVANCGYGHGYSVLDVLESVRRMGGRSLDVRYSARREGDQASVVADSSRARAALGWSPQFDSLDQIVSDSLAWEHALTRKNAALGRS